MMAQVLNDNAGDLRCSICLKTFKEPKVLPCCHTFCKGCLSQLPVIKKPRMELSVRGEQLSVYTDGTLSLESTVQDQASARSSSSTDELESPGDSYFPSRYRKTVESVPEPVAVLSEKPGGFSFTPCQEFKAQEDIARKSYLQCPHVAENRLLDDADKDTAPIINKPSKYVVNYIICPQCRAEHEIVEPGGVDGFPNDFIVESQLREQTNVNGCKVIQCDGCGESSEPVVACCYDCAEHLCEFCCKAHKKLKKFVGHNVRELADIDEVAKETLVLRKPQRRCVCPRHPTEIVQLYCQSCDATVCNKCIVSCAHNGHKLSEIDSQTKKKVHKQLISLSAKVDKDLKLQMKNLNYIKKVEKVTNDMAVDVEQKINSTFDSYVAALGKRRKELLSDSESRCSKKMKVLWSEKDSLERVVADMTTTQNFTERIKNCEDSKEFLLLSSQALPRLKKLESWKWKDGVIEEIEHYRLNFQESDLKVGQISGAGSLDEDHVLYNIDLQGVTDAATLGEQHSFTIHVTRGKCCRPWMRIKTPQVTIKHIQSCTCNVAELHIESIDEPQKEASFESMDDEKKWEITNKWMITYIPYCGGRHRLTIKVGDMLTHKKEITVHGMPPVGSIVIGGPDSHGNIEGTVVSLVNSGKPGYISKTVDVQVHQRSLYSGNKLGHNTFSWGKDGRYEIQLQHTQKPYGGLTLGRARDGFLYRL